MPLTIKMSLASIARAAADWTRVDVDALCDALGIKSRGEELPIEVFRFAAARYAFHYDRALATTKS